MALIQRFYVVALNKNEEVVGVHDAGPASPMVAVAEEFLSRLEADGHSNLTAKIEPRFMLAK